MKNANIAPGQWLVVVGAGGGLGHFAGKLLMVEIVGYADSL